MAIAPSVSDAQTRFPVSEVVEFVRALLGCWGVPGRLSGEVADALIEADQEGTASHGLALLPLYLDRIASGSVSPKGEGRIISDRGGAIVLDAEHGLGQVTSARAVTLAIERARGNGVASIAVRNAFHFGAAGRWARLMAEQGCIGIAMSNTRPLMPAPGGADRLVGNNPLAIAVPVADGDPLTLDFALSEAAMGKIRLAEAEGRPIPAGWATDQAGLPTTDAASAIKGMLLPAAAAKGFGLAMMIDLLAGGLSSGGIGDRVTPLYGDPAIPYGCAHLFLALGIEAFRPLAEFTAAASGFANRIRSSKPLANADPVRVPGDGRSAARLRNGSSCPLSHKTAAALRERGQRHGLNFPDPLQ